MSWFSILLALQVVLWLFAISPTKTYGTDLNSHYFEHSGRSLAAGSGAWYINCGAPEDSKDERGINLESDNEYADSGNSSSISSSLSTNNAGTLWEELKSLRSFPKGQRNCYTLRLTKQQSSNISYLITALFLYGNYDGANSPPTFDLYVGNTFWTKVQIESADKVYFHDVVHTPKADSVMISVCLVNTSLGTPFVSALQVRPLKQDSVYWIDSGRQLTLLQRDDCGGNASTPQRFDGDEYDRIWENDKIFEKTIVRETNRSFSVGSSDQPPLGVLRTAIKPNDQSTYLNHEFGDSNSSYLVYLHFAETEEYHSRLHKRIFVVGFNNVTNGSYTLDSVNPKVVYPKNPIPGPINISITYECDRDRDLPILNAMEIFQVVPVSENVTHPDDVNAMLDIKRAYKIQIEDWQGDPCFPIGLDSCWSRLSCSKVSDKSPARIISLNLSSVGLAGNLTESISNLKLIERLDVSNNNLTGSVPESFEQLDLLKEV